MIEMFKMLKMFKSKDYLVVLLMALAAFVLLSLNPSALQNKRYKVDGDSCPDASWHALLLLLIGTAAFVYIRMY